MVYAKDIQIVPSLDEFGVQWFSVIYKGRLRLMTMDPQDAIDKANHLKAGC